VNTIKLSIRQAGDVSVVDVVGRVTLGEGSSALGDTLRGLASKGSKKVLVNLAEVSYIDSSAIGELISGYSTLSKVGGQLKLTGLSKRVKDLLLITKNYTIFDIQDDEAAAVGSFK
jgi:anti-sigma B factor antagonist